MFFEVFNESNMEFGPIDFEMSISTFSCIIYTIIVAMYFFWLPLHNRCMRSQV